MVLHFNRKRWHNFAFCWKARNKIIYIFFNHLRSEHNWRVARAYQVVVRCDEFEWIFGMRVLQSFEIIYEKLFVMPPKCHNEIFFFISSLIESYIPYGVAEATERLMLYRTQLKITSAFQTNPKATQIDYINGPRYRNVVKLN